MLDTDRHSLYSVPPPNYKGDIVLSNPNEAVKIVVILDESGSMYHLQMDVIGGFNRLIDEQKALEGAADVTLYTFSSGVRMPIDGKNVQEVEPLSVYSYSPDGGTAMNDAIGQALTKLLFENPAKAIINIFTDGQENASREYSREQVKELIAQAEAKGYQVVFLAANMDEVSVGASMGLMAGSTRGFSANAVGMEYAYLQASSATTNYRSTPL